MRKIIFTIILLYSASSFSQEIKSLLTLDEAVKYAIENSPVLNIEKMKLEQANIKVIESQLGFIPNIYLSGDFRRNLIIPETPVPANVFDPTVQNDELMYLKFNTKWNTSAGININYDLFNPEKINRVAEQKHQLKIQEYDAQITEDDLREKIALAYAECVIANEQKLLLIGDTAFYTALLNNSNQLFLKEKISLVEKNNSQKAYNESIIDLLEAEKIANDRKAELLYLIGMEVTLQNIESLSLQEDIETLLKKMEHNSLPSFDIEKARQQEVVDLAQLRIKTASLKYAPTLTLNGYYGSNYYKNDLTLFNNNFWRGNSYVGLSIKVPITQSLSTSKEVSRLRLQKLMENENLRDLQNIRNKDRLNDLSQLQVRKENHRLNHQNWEMSRQNSQAAQVQFDKGYIKQSDLLNEIQKMKQNRQLFLQSAYDLFNSLITMK